jgi:hypothetical protein
MLRSVVHNSRHRCGIVASTLPAAPRTTLRALAVLLGCAALAGLGGWLIDQPAIIGGVEDLLPMEHRPPAGSHLRLSLRGPAAADSWPQIVDQLGPQLPGHFPLSPPPAEARGWLDAHILYRIAPSEHAALAARLEPAAMRAAVAGIRARLASPLFGVSDEQPRRDPLGLRALGAADPGYLGAGAASAPIPTASGDLLSADGRTLLLYLRTGLPPAHLHAWASAQLSARFGVDTGIELNVFPITANVAPTERSSLRLVDLLAATFAALVLVLTLGLRRTRIALALVVVVAAAAPLVVLLAGARWLDAPVLLALLGVVLALAVPLAVHRGVGVLGPCLRLALALTPLLLLPYPVWQRWAWVWALALLGLALVVRGLGPPLLRLCAARPPAPRRARPPRRWPPLVAFAVLLALLAAGTWSSRHVAEVPYDLGAADAALAAEFFPPSRVAELRAIGADEPAALGAAVDDAARLAALGPEVAVRVDAPGSLLLSGAEAEARKAALAGLDLPGRIDLLRVALTEQGLRPDAFGEFIRALDPNRLPTPAAALAGPLAGWLATRLERDGTGVAALSRVLLAEDLPADLTLPADLRGPAVFAHAEARARDARLGLLLAAAAWLSAFLTWLSARRLAVALTAALVGLAAQAGALALLVAAGGVGLPLLLPALLLVGACAAELAARACAAPVPADSSIPGAVAPVLRDSSIPGAVEPVPADSSIPGAVESVLGDSSIPGAVEPVPADSSIPGAAAPVPAAIRDRPALVVACQVAPALVLLATPEPAWRSFGLVLGFGGLLGLALATRVAPGLCALLRRLTREEPRP